MLSIEDIMLDNKNVVLRLDLNVPIKDNKIMDNTRIVKSLKTINYLLDRNCNIIILSHLGKVKCEEDKFKNSLEIVSKELSSLLNKNCLFTRDFDNVKDIIKTMNNDVLLLENTRWFDYPNKLESSCDSDLSKYFASLGDIFVNDAFGVNHRKHASNYGISKYIDCYIGFLIKEELTALNHLNDPERPYVVIMGGSKISDKILLINNLINKCDKLLIGGGMAYTFLKSKGYDVGTSIVDDENIDFCKELLSKYESKIVLPVDFKCNNKFIDEAGVNITLKDSFRDLMGLDIGIKTRELFKNTLNDAKTILWNGPLGVYEFNNYQEGTKDILEFINKLDSYTVLGGGDIVACANLFNLNNNISHISTGGGATLDYLEKGYLVGLEYIKRK